MKKFLQWILQTFFGKRFPKITWGERLTRAMFFFSAPNYYWESKSKKEVSKILDAILDAGLDGPSIELGGQQIIGEYLGKKITDNIKTIYLNNFDKWQIWEDGIRERGLVAHIVFLNSNQSAANKISDAEWHDLVKNFVLRYGSRNKIIEGVSERDARTRSSIVSTVTKAVEEFVPHEQIVTYGDGNGAFHEHHSKNGHDVPLGKNMHFLFVNDSGPAIAYLYGSDYRSKPVLNKPNMISWVVNIKASHGSGVVYSISKEFDYEGCSLAGDYWNNKK